MTIATETKAAGGKRERILRAAVDVFAQTGYHNARVSDVARVAGVADGTIYLYFTNKEELLVTIFRESAHRHFDALRDALRAASDPAVKIRIAIEHHLRAFGADRALAIVMQVELRQSLKFITQLTRDEVTAYLTILKEIVEEGQKKGAFRTNFHPQLVANSIFGIVDELVTAWILSEKEYALADQSGEVSELVLGGLAKPR
jgi:TetR/AcrR family transcriptional regulator, fatty acid metabolism regulator protein